MHSTIRVALTVMALSNPWFPDYLFAQPQQPKLIHRHDHTGAATSVAFLSDSKSVITSGEDNRIKLWTDSVDQARDVINLGEPDRIFSPFFVVEPSRTTVFVIHNGTFVEAFDTTLWKSKWKRTIQHRGILLAICPRNPVVCVCSSDRQRVIHLLATGTGRSVGDLVFKEGDWIPGLVYSSFSPDGSMLAAAYGGFGCVVWDIKKGMIIEKHEDELLTGPIQFLTNGTLVITPWGDNGKAKIWTPQTKRLKEAPGLPKGVCCFSPIGTHDLLVGDLKGNVARWNWKDDSTLWAMKCDDSQIIRLAMSPDGKRFATAAESGRVKVFEMPK